MIVFMSALIYIWKMKYWIDYNNWLILHIKVIYFLNTPSYDDTIVIVIGILSSSRLSEIVGHNYLTQIIYYQ